MDMTIDAVVVERMLEDSKGTKAEKLDEILDRAESLRGLAPEDVAALLTMDSQPHLARLFKIAGRIKEEIYGERIVMFAPLYVSDYCVNRCRYCGYSCDNKFDRRRLTLDEIRNEAEILERMGHKRLALEAGEDPVNCSIDYMLDAIRVIYNMKAGPGEIRRVNVNIAATTEENFKKLHDIGIGTYILFQETYHEPTYFRMHEAGPKRNFEYHLTAFDRAMRSGIDDVGGGVLFGLYDWRFEVLGLMLHNQHLDRTYGAGFHTISSPRLRPAAGMDMSEYENLLSDEDFKRVVATIRIAVPYTGMIISTRESAEMRRELIRLGISQVSGGSSVEVGGYAIRESGGEQFEVADSRSAMDIMRWLMDEKLVPSFCTACYRKGRTGDRFMSLAKSGNIKNVCLPNALMTLCEYMMDYGDEEFRLQAASLIDSNIPRIKSDNMRELTKGNIEKIKSGERDLFV
ncbi:MAG: [FeFe] hydrogenase H-cluster radical SAM maturase HydG [Synergistaceae bacterium]|jgi:2-iminoacetate synthase|nr:[FeFe] hydrogenase H-cluster radical SAM maturase HydG [Synergistaceae bacterium]